jgi:hypothetical protein
MNNITEFGHHTRKQTDSKLLNCLCIFFLLQRLICTLRLSLPPTIVKCFFKNKSKNRKNNEKKMRLQISVRSKQKRKKVCVNVSYRSACSVFLSNAHNIKKSLFFLDSSHIIMIVEIVTMTSSEEICPVNYSTAKHA